MRKTKIEAPNLPMLKGVRDVPEVEDFFWPLENYFKQGKLMDDKANINTTILYLSHPAIL